MEIINRLELTFLVCSHPVISSIGKVEAVVLEISLQSLKLSRGTHGADYDIYSGIADTVY